MRKRGSGILLHVSSLPSSFGVGDLGPSAYRFADFLETSGQSFWQVLPLTLTDTFYGNSPYSSISAFAGNEIFISPESLFENGYISRQTLDGVRVLDSDKVDYVLCSKNKALLLGEAYSNFKKNDPPDGYENFIRDNESWLDDFALFRAIKHHFGGSPWYDWPDHLKHRESSALEDFMRKERDLINREKFKQFIFMRQWSNLKEYCNNKGIQIIGDMPIYVIHDSVEVWKHPDIFQLDANKMPSFIAGVPPDYFSETGQLWGNPLYDWENLKRSNFEWWKKRLEHNFRLFDMTRIDHFRGLIAYWKIPAGSENAINGRWADVPFKKFFNALLKRFAFLPIIVEDLGTITSDVREIVKDYDLPGMKVLLFAFGDDDPQHPYLPHMYSKNCLAYTGVHDTNTVKGWYENECGEEQIGRICNYLEIEKNDADLNWKMIRSLMMSVADKVIVPMQDLLGLSSEGRMNHPGGGDNWGWKLKSRDIVEGLDRKLFEMTRKYGRL